MLWSTFYLHRYIRIAILWSFTNYNTQISRNYIIFNLPVTKTTKKVYLKNHLKDVKTDIKCTHIVDLSISSFCRMQLINNYNNFSVHSSTVLANKTLLNSIIPIIIIFPSQIFWSQVQLSSKPKDSSERNGWIVIGNNQDLRFYVYIVQSRNVFH